MQVNVYAVKNETTKIYGQPFCATTDEEARTMFERAFKEAKEKTDEEFKLVKIGKYDIISGNITGGLNNDI